VTIAAVLRALSSAHPHAEARAPPQVVEAVWRQGGGLADIPVRDNVVKPSNLTDAFRLAAAVHGGLGEPRRVRQLHAAFQAPSAEAVRVRREEQRRAMKANREATSLRANMLMQLKARLAGSGGAGLLSTGGAAFALLTARPPPQRHALPLSLSLSRVLLTPRPQVINAHTDFAPLYFPHNLDFRGRAYPMSPHFNHMNSDMCRGVLLFSDAAPLGERGFSWLLVHLANVVGEVDKRSFAAREAWSLAHLTHVLDSADAPLSGARWWAAAEKPWQALATCVEVAAALRSGDVRTYRCRLPVHQDGSCNGLQHYAAMGGDVEGAQAVNVLDALEPQVCA